MTQTPTEPDDRSSTVVVVATLFPAAGRLAEALDVIRANVPVVHEERGCLTYAVHTAQDPERVVFIERWTSEQALAAHAGSVHMARTQERLAPLLERPSVVETATPVPMGTPEQGVF